VQAVSNVWNEPWEELLSARGTGARQTALFIGRIRGRLSLKELGQLAGGIHHNAVGIAIRRFTHEMAKIIPLCCSDSQHLQSCQR
jgi:hypothetical protein